MKVVIAPDSFGGTATAPQAAEAIAAGWRRARPADEVVTVPLADGGEGTIEALRAAGGTVREVEVADPLGKPRTARWLLRADGTAVIESAEACGLALLTAAQRNPLTTTTYGVGQLLEDARRAGARRLAVGLGGSATVDGGAGAAIALGFRVLRGDGTGLKVGGGELHTVASIAPVWVAPDWETVDVELWADVTTPLLEAPAVFGPQKGAIPEMVAVLDEGMRRWADVVERDLGGSWRDEPGSGAAGGLGFGLRATIGGRLVRGAAAVGELAGLPDAVAGADVLVTGEGRLDATSLDGKVAGYVADLAAAQDARALAVVGQLDGPRPEAFGDLEEAAPSGPGDDPLAEIEQAAHRLAARI